MFGRKHQLAMALQALRYYGNEETYRRRGRKDDYQPAPFTTDHGKRARAALEAIRDDQARSVLSRVGALFRRRPTSLGVFEPPRVPKALSSSERRARKAFEQSQRDVAALNARRDREEAAA
ncbi:hypothetical protein DyAD56_16050 [Dyella sp. AD56]|uniref:hypothetical protein n=1 Tax=Dyella sp. AD56 TaxID=1528744 RepID=UPI000C81F0CE|nr:hypothetical protein [Dyella sp. AD56]PMQ04201.1 hypothetical protein DyAD56_16050 [Dyella sp. AD56]